MRPDFHSLVSLELAAERIQLADWQPPDPDCFGIRVMAFIGAEDLPGSDAFDFVACTPRWWAQRLENADLREAGAWNNSVLPALSVHHQTSDPGAFVNRPAADEPAVIAGAGLLFMRRWDYRALEASIRRLCESIEGPDWGTVAERLGRLLEWEYAGEYDRARNTGEPFPPKRPASDP